MASPAATADSDSNSNPSQPNSPVPITVPSSRAHLHHHHHHLLDRRDTPQARAWEPEGTLRPRPGAMDGAAKPEAKLVAGEAGYVLEDVPHVSDYLPNLPTYPNPLQENPSYSVVKQYFVNPDDTVYQKIVVHKDGPRGNQFRRAGPRQKVYFKSDEVHACIVTCGGLCPGLNTVIREIVCGLSDMYGDTKILGIQVITLHHKVHIKYASSYFFPWDSANCFFPEVSLKSSWNNCYTPVSISFTSAQLHQPDNQEAALCTS